MFLSLLPLVAKYWWVAAIVVLLAGLKIQDARLHNAQAAVSGMKAQIAAMNQQNHSLKLASDECNARVDQMQRDGAALQASLNDATRNADAITAAGVRAAGDAIAHPPADDCKSILLYGHREAAQFKW